MDDYNEMAFCEKRKYANTFWKMSFMYNKLTLTQ